MPKVNRKSASDELYGKIRNGEIRVKWSGPNVSSLELRFWGCVDKDGPVIREELGPCWRWTGALTGRPINGVRYGAIRCRELGKSIHAHRCSYMIHYGKIPIAMCVLHRCDNLNCVNPGHLFLGTVKDNNDDKMMKGRHRTKGSFGDRNGARTCPEKVQRGSQLP